jgi:hypothetical protein
LDRDEWFDGAIPISHYIEIVIDESGLLKLARRKGRNHENK